MLKHWFRLWLLSMIALPIMRWLWGDTASPWALSLAVLAQVILVTGYLGTAIGRSFTGVLLIGLLPLCWAVEWVGSRTGFPFGNYQYTGLLAPQLGGVPLLIPLAWLMMLVPSWAVASGFTSRLTGLRGWPRALVFCGFSALAFTAWDLFLDPLLVAWGFWQWPSGGAYFGIPWVNYAGWLGVSAALTGLVLLGLGKSHLDFPPVAHKGLMTVYGITAALLALGLALFWGLPGPALWGAVAMFACWGLAKKNTR
jgi:lycopene beta-cyclase